MEELRQAVAASADREVRTNAGALELSPDGTSIRVNGVWLGLGPAELATLSQCVNGPRSSSLRGIASGSRGEIVNRYLWKASEVKITVRSDGDVEAVWPTSATIPVPRVVEAFERAVGANAWLHSVHLGARNVSVDVSSSDLRVEPVLGEVCGGGLSLRVPLASNLDRRDGRWVGSHIVFFLHRCGLRRWEPEAAVDPTQDAEEVIKCVERASRQLLTGIVPIRMAQLAALAAVEIATPGGYLRQLALDHGLPPGISRRALEAASSLPAPTSAYRVLETVTVLQLQNGVSRAQRERLIEFCGDVVAAGGRQASADSVVGSG